MQKQYNEYERVKGVAKYTGASVSTIWLWSKQGKLNPIRLSERVTVWRMSDVDAFIASRMGVVA